MNTLGPGGPAVAAYFSGAFQRPSHAMTAEEHLAHIKAMSASGDIHAGHALDEFAHGVAIVDADLIESRVGHAVDEHAREPRLAEIGQRAALRIGARRQNDAVDATLMEGLDDFELAGGIVLGVGEEDHHAEARALGLDRADDVAEIGI